MGLLAVLGLWLMSRTVSGDRTVPGHPFHVILLVPAGILTWHVVRHGLLVGPAVPGALAGGLDMSMLFHLALLAGAVLLTQCLLSGDVGQGAVVAACGAALMVGSVCAVVWEQAVQARAAVALLGFAGVAVCSSLLSPSAPRPGAGPAFRVFHRRGVRLACMAAGAAASGVFAWSAPLAAVWAGIVVGVVLVVAGCVSPRGRVVMPGLGGLLAVAGGGVLVMTGEPVGGLDLAAATCIGSGEEAFVRLSAESSGLAILVAATGWCGCGWVLLGACVWAVRLLARSARRGVDGGRAIAWVAAVGLSGSALLAGGGAFIPAGSLAVAFVWGVTPAMLGQTARRRPGPMLLVPVVLLILVLGIARSSGLVLWMSNAYGCEDKVLHVVAGAVLAAVSAWLFGSKRWWAGLLAIGVTGLAGGAGELAQWFFGFRGVELADWSAHAVGSAMVAGPYGLCMVSRWCESADAAPRAIAAQKGGPYGRMGRGPGGG